MAALATTPLARLAPKRVAILRALMLGDVLCATPALRAFRNGLPDAEIVLVGLAWARELADRLGHLVDGYLELPGFPGLPESSVRADRLADFLATARAHRFDLAVQLHGDGRMTNPLVGLLHPRRMAGFHAADAPPPDPDFFLRWPDEGHEIRRLLRLTDRLGLPAQGEELEFPLRPEDALELADRAPGLRPGGYAVVHPGARSADPWATEGFAAVADHLAGQGLEIVLTGTAEEADATAAVASAMRTPARDLAGRTSLGALGALLAGSRVLVSNDTGVSHLAAALRVPSVVVVTTSDPARWAPLDRELHHVLVRPERAEPVIAEVDDLLARAA